MTIPNADLEAIKEKILFSLYVDSETEKEPFCKTFALMARFAGWKWRFDPESPSMDEISALYDSLVNTIVDNVRDINDKNIAGSVWSFTCSTGRIVMTINYWQDSGSVQFRVTCDITP